jgi:hypothetical protein
MDSCGAPPRHQPVDNSIRTLGSIAKARLAPVPGAGRVGAWTSPTRAARWRSLPAGRGRRRMPGIRGRKIGRVSGLPAATLPASRPRTRKAKEPRKSPREPACRCADMNPPGPGTGAVRIPGCARSMTQDRFLAVIGRHLCASGLLTYSGTRRRQRRDPVFVPAEGRVEHNAREERGNADGRSAGRGRARTAGARAAGRAPAAITSLCLSPLAAAPSRPHGLPTRTPR